MWSRIAKSGYYMVISALLVIIASTVIGFNSIKQATPVQAVRNEKKFWLQSQEQIVEQASILFSQHDTTVDGDIVHVTLVEKEAELLGQIKITDPLDQSICHNPFKDLPDGIRFDFIKSLGSSIVINAVLPEFSVLEMSGMSYSNTTAHNQAVAMIFNQDCGIEEIVQSIVSSSTFSKQLVDRSGNKVCYASATAIQCLKKGMEVVSRVYELENISKIHDITIGDAGNIIFVGDLGTRKDSLVMDGHSYTTKGRYMLGNINSVMNEIDWFYSDDNSIIDTIDYDYGMLVMAGSSNDNEIFGFKTPDTSTTLSDDESLILALDIDKRTIPWIKTLTRYEGDLITQASKGVLYLLTHIDDLESPRLDSHGAEKKALHIILLNIVDGSFEYVTSLSNMHLRYAGLNHSNELMISGQSHSVSPHSQTEEVSLFWGIHSEDIYPKHIRCYEEGDKQCGIIYI